MHPLQRKQPKHTLKIFTIGFWVHEQTSLWYFAGGRRCSLPIQLAWLLECLGCSQLQPASIECCNEEAADSLHVRAFHLMQCLVSPASSSLQLRYEPAHRALDTLFTGRVYCSNLQICFDILTCRPIGVFRFIIYYSLNTFGQLNHFIVGICKLIIRCQCSHHSFPSMRYLIDNRNEENRH